MGQLVWIRGPIQRNFGPSFIRQVYFIHKSTDCCDMRKDCQKIKTSHSFLTILIISYKLPLINQLLTPLSLKNFSPVCWSYAVKLLSCLRGCKLKPSFKDRLPWSRSLFSEWPSKTFLLKIHQDDLAAPTHQFFASTAESRETSSFKYHLTKTKRSKYHFHLGLISSDYTPTPQYENPPHVLISRYHSDSIFGWWDRID